jgi:hypothetical protein
MYPIIPSIAHILRDLATQFRLYESYLVHHKMAISEIANARKKNNKLGQLVKNLEADIPPGPPGRILTLESLLTKPFQRLCKYPLLVMVRNSFISNFGDWRTLRHRFVRHSEIHTFFLFSDIIESNSS